MSGGVLYEKVSDEIEKDLEITDITATELQNEIIGPIISKEYTEQVTKRKKDDKYLRNLTMYFDSVFQDFESFLRTEVDLIEDIRLVLDDYISNFITHELEQGLYNFEDLSKALFKILEPEYELFNSSVLIELDDITMKTILVVRRGIIDIRFDEKLFLINVLGFTPGWNYKHYNEYISQKIVNLSTTNKIHLKTIVINGGIVDGSRQPILYSFVLDKPAVYKVFSQLETVFYKKNK